jgi:multiple sugar transport system permease protein
LGTHTPVAVIERTRQARRLKTRRRALPDNLFALLLISPAALFLGVSIGWPLEKLVHDSLYEILPLAGTKQYVGLRNYTNAVHSPEFTGAATRTVVYTVFVVALELGFGLATALLFNALGHRSRILRTFFLYPLMIAPIVAGLLWRFLLLDNIGIVNQLLSDVGILHSAGSVSWLSDPNVVLFSVGFSDIWLTTSFMSLVLFAGLQNIPAELLEAARIDGAAALQRFRWVILPLLRPVIAVAVIVRGIDAARAFDVILIQTNGGPQQKSETLSLLIYQTMVRYGEPGLASAMSVMYLGAMLLIAAVALLTIWRPGRRPA